MQLGTDGRAGTSVRLRDIDFHRPLLLQPGAPASVQVKLVARRARIVGRPHPQPRRRGSELGAQCDGNGRRRKRGHGGLLPSEPLESIRRRCTAQVHGPGILRAHGAAREPVGPVVPGRRLALAGRVGSAQPDRGAASDRQMSSRATTSIRRSPTHPARCSPPRSRSTPAAARAGGAFVGGGIEAVQVGAPTAGSAVLGARAHPSDGARGRTPTCWSATSRY